MNTKIIYRLRKFKIIQNGQYNNLYGFIFNLIKKSEIERINGTQHYVNNKIKRILFIWEKESGLFLVNFKYVWKYIIDTYINDYDASIYLLQGILEEYYKFLPPDERKFNPVPAPLNYMENRIKRTNGY